MILNNILLKANHGFYFTLKSANFIDYNHFYDKKTV